MKSKSDLVGVLIDAIYKNCPDENVREEIYSEFISELMMRDFDNLSFIDECTEDEVFWHTLQLSWPVTYGDEEEDDENSSEFEQDLLSVIAGVDIDSNDDDDTSDESEDDSEDYE